MVISNLVEAQIVLTLSAPLTMPSAEIFTLEEARSLLPELKRLLSRANDELDNLSIKLEGANQAFAEAEKKLLLVKAPSNEVTDLSALREGRKEFQEAIKCLATIQQKYLDCLTNWLERISKTGVILRDLRSGLIDFPARQGNVDYYLCWRLGERDIDFWHLADDGFQGRKPLAVLDEYF